MRIQANFFWPCIVIALSLVILSGTQKENKYINYTVTYNDNDYIVLRKKQPVDNQMFIPNPAHGKLIPDSVADAEITMYRKKNPGGTRYIDFNFHSLLGYIASFQNVENPDENKTLGVRIYPALDLETKQLTVIISPTRDDKSLWKKKNSINGRDFDRNIDAFNTGSLCPNNCPDGDTTIHAR